MKTGREPFQQPVIYSIGVNPENGTFVWFDANAINVVEGLLFRPIGEDACPGYQGAT